jgi:hypothetical protein
LQRLSGDPFGLAAHRHDRGRLKKLHLFMFVDALGWRIVQEHGFLKDLLPNQSPCHTVFGYSSTCDPTILTGCMPDEHGHFSCFVQARDARPFESLGKWGWLPEKIAGHHRVRNRVSRAIGKKLGYTGYFQLYSVPFRYLPYLDYTEKRDIYEPGGILGGQESIFAHWERSGKKWMRSDWRNGDDQNIDEITAAIRKEEIELAYLFTGRLDAIMHEHGTRGPEVEKGLRWYEEKIRGMFEAAAGYDEFHLSLFSDHGMTDTEHLSPLMLEFEKLGYAYGTDYVAAWDSTMVRFWFPGDESVKEKIVTWLQMQPDGAVVSETLLKQWNCWFPDGRYGELFYLLPPGTIFAPSFMNQKRVPGMHGYDPDHPDSAACWLTNHPTARAPGLQNIFKVMQDAMNSE